MQFPFHTFLSHFRDFYTLYTFVSIFIILCMFSYLHTMYLLVFVPNTQNSFLPFDNIGASACHAFNFWYETFP